MFDRVSEAAEKLVKNVSRREFMGRLGRSATVIAGVIGGLCAAPRVAQGNPPITGAPCCWGGDHVITGGCAAPMKHCSLVSADCTGCVWNCKGVMMTSVCAMI